MDKKDVETIVNAMEEKKFKPNDVVIKQGDEGDNLYVVETGTLQCSKLFVRTHLPYFDIAQRYKAKESEGVSARRSFW